MNTEQHEEMASLFVRIFDAASAIVEEHERDDYPEFLPDTIMQDLREEYPALALSTHPDKEMFLEILAGEYQYPHENTVDTIRLLTNIWKGIHSERPGQVLQNARLGLGLISHTLHHVAVESDLFLSA